MERPRAYVESTLPSFYHEARTAPEPWSLRWNSWEKAMNPNQNDPVIDEIRDVRHRISERFDHDPARLVAYYVELQERYRDRLIDTSKGPEDKDLSAA